MLEIKKNNTTVELRNLQEQVQKNKEDIAKHYEIDRVLANAGMRIIGILQTPEELPDPLTYDGEYGDTYAIGFTTPYDYYIFTAPNPNAGYLNKHWLNIGPISIEGAQGIPGPRGEIGPQGLPGTKWRNGSVIPSKLVTDLEGDYYLNTSTGDVYKFVNLNWTVVGNIKGAQGPRGLQGIQGPQGATGPQGPQGEKGDSAGYISINGILENANQLPTPSSLDNLSLAYLIGSSTPYNLYIQVGDNSDTAVWQNVGPFNIGTAVTADGIIQSQWNSDLKLDKITSSGSNRVYSVNGYGQQTSIRVGYANYSGRIPTFTTEYASGITDNGGFLVCSTPTNLYHAANKNYVDNKISEALDNINIEVPTGNYVLKETEVIPQNAGNRAAYGLRWDEDGNPIDSTILLSSAPFMGAIASYTLDNGTLQTNNPVNNLDCVNKQYADGTYLSKVTTTTNMDQVYVKATNGSQTVLNILPSPSSGTSGIISKAYADGYLASKEYVDNKVIGIFSLDGTTLTITTM